MPGTSLVSSFTKIMEKISQEIIIAQANGQYPYIFGLGDYNFPVLHWEQGMLPSPVITKAQKGLNLLGFMRDHLLFHVIQYPMNNIMDLIMVNYESIINTYSQDINTMLSNHNTILMKMKIYFKSMKRRTIEKKLLLH